MRMDGSNDGGVRPTIGLHLDGTGAWPDLALREAKIVTDFELAVLPRGTAQGRPSVVLRVNLDDGQVVIVQTSLRLLTQALAAVHARYGDDD